MLIGTARLELAYRYAAAAYRFAERRCHDDVVPAHAEQRDITRWPLEVVRGVRSDVQPFTNLLIQFPQSGTNEPGQIKPDNALFIHPYPLAPGDSYNTPLQPVGPFLVLEYVSKASARKDEETSYAKYEQELKVPYYLLFYPDADEFTLFRLGEKGYTSVVPNALGRCPIPELELEVGQLGRWVRYWFRGELLPLPGDLLKERDAALQQRDDAQRQLSAERQVRQTAEAELARLREELAKARGQELRAQCDRAASAERRSRTASRSARSAEPRKATRRNRTPPRLRRKRNVRSRGRSRKASLIPAGWGWQSFRLCSCFRSCLPAAPSGTCLPGRPARPSGALAPSLWRWALSCGPNRGADGAHAVLTISGTHRTPPPSSGVPHVPTNGSLNRKLRMGLIGGGQGSFIGRVHATAAVLDNRAALVAGALSSDAARAKASASDYDIPAERAYTSYKEMAEAEAKRADKVDFVSVATPNHTHFEIAKTFTEAGFNVICDKPLTFDLAQAEELLKVVEKSGVVFAVTHNYTGYPLVRQAREMVLNGELGEINAIRSNYIQGWLRDRLETGGQKQAAWRTDPSKSGIAGCFGDIGTHAYNLGRFITGLLPTEISCSLKIFADGRALDDYGVALVRFENGALATVTASQISHGRENDLFIEVDGTKGAIEWHQEEPNKLLVRKNGEPHKLYTRNGGPYLGAAHGASVRLPSGHPEAFFEAFANVYGTAYDAMVKRAAGESFETVNTVYPNVYDGVEGMLFITKCVESSKQNGGWIAFHHPKSRK